MEAQELKLTHYPKGERILIIDDDQDIRELMAETLSREGYEVFTAENGRRGLEVVKYVKPDLVLCDIVMPDLDGYGVLAEVNRIYPAHKVPLVYITGLTGKEEYRMAMEIGANDYLVKPFDSLELKKCIETQLKKSRSLGTYIKLVRRRLLQSACRRIRSLKARVNNQTGKLDQIASENCRLGNELIKKDIELTQEGFRVIDINKIIENLKHEISTELKRPDINSRELHLLKRLLRRSGMHDHHNRTWSVFQMHFDKSHPGFVNMVGSRFPGLTPLELSIICALAVNMETNQLADMLSVLPETVRKSKYRIKKKLGMPRTENLRGLIHQMKLEFFGTPGKPNRKQP